MCVCVCVCVCVAFFKYPFHDCVCFGVQPSGFAVPARSSEWDADRVVVVSEFMSLYAKCHAGLSDEPYTPPQEPIPTGCDFCSKPCVSECMCGELFCSRECLQRHWTDHRDLSPKP